MLTGKGVNQPLSRFAFALCHKNPGVFQYVGDLAEQRVDALQAARKHLMHLIFHGTAVTQVVDVNRIRRLADALNSALALFQPGRIPWQIEIDQTRQTLKIQTL
jgi:hypothetical protein